MFEQSTQFLKRAKEFIPGGCSTESKKAEALFATEEAPAYFKSAKGAKLIDVDGNEFVDFGMALGSCILGYAHPIVDDAIEQELRNGIVSILPSTLELKLAELVVDTFPSIEMVRFLKTGAEACSAAIRIARALTERDHILASGYFGWHDWVNKGAGVPEYAKELCTEFAFNDSVNFLDKLSSLPEPPAAVIMEPVINEHPKKEFLNIIRESCDRFGIVLIWDEMKTGARLAKGGAQQYYKFSPDLTILGKGIANGMPLAVVGGKKEIMKTWDNVWICSTYAGESLSIAAAIASLSFILRNPVSSHIERLGKKLLTGFQNIAKEFPDLCRVTGIPQMNSIGLSDDLPDAQNLEAEFFSEVLNSGFMIRRQGYNFVSYAHSDRNIDRCLAVVHDAFKKLEKKK